MYYLSKFAEISSHFTFYPRVIEFKRLFFSVYYILNKELIKMHYLNKRHTSIDKTNDIWYIFCNFLKLQCAYIFSLEMKTFTEMQVKNGNDLWRHGLQFAFKFKRGVRFLKSLPRVIISDSQLWHFIKLSYCKSDIIPCNISKNKLFAKVLQPKYVVLCRLDADTRVCRIDRKFESFKRLWLVIKISRDSWSA